MELHCVKRAHERTKKSTGEKHKLSEMDIIHKNGSENSGEFFTLANFNSFLVALISMVD